MTGGGHYVSCRVDQDGKPISGGVQVKTIVPGMVIHIELYTAHAFSLEPGTEIVCHSTAPFDPDDLKKFVLR